MPRKKTKQLLSRLSSDERAEVLSALLKRHPDLHDEAIAIARNLIDDVSVEAVAEEVVDLVTNIDYEELNNRAGKHSWGYVEPGEAAWELLEEAIEDLRDGMKRRFEAGTIAAAEKMCQGIILGLHRVDGISHDGALGWAPDFPSEAATWSLSLLLELYPQRQRRTAGTRIVKAVEEHAEEWGERLTRVVEEK